MLCLLSIAVLALWQLLADPWPTLAIDHTDNAIDMLRLSLLPEYDQETKAYEMDEDTR